MDGRLGTDEQGQSIAAKAMGAERGRASARTTERATRMCAASGKQEEGAVSLKGRTPGTPYLHCPHCQPRKQHNLNGCHWEEQE